MNNTAEQPLVSVIIGTYNGAKWIKRAIDSILNQTYKNLEIIVCNDASTDNTLSILKEEYGNVSNISILSNEKNSGLNITLNNCINHCNGDLIARMDDDDISHPTRIEKEVKFLQEHPEYTVVGTSVNYFDETGIWAQSISEGERNKKDIFLGRIFTHPTVIIRKAPLLEVGMYSVGKLYTRGQDWDLWCKLYRAGYKGYNMKEILFDYYESKESVKRRKIKYRFYSVVKVFKWRRKLKLPFWYDYTVLIALAKCFIPKQVFFLLHKRSPISRVSKDESKNS
jgi:glycosyltransferase EpsE